MKQVRPNWQSWLIAAILGAALPAACFFLKLKLTEIGMLPTAGTIALSILPVLVLAGAIAGLIAGLMSLFLKKPAVSALLAAADLVVWIVLPGSLWLSSVLLGFGGILSLTAIPFFALLLASALPQTDQPTPQ